MKQVIIGTQTRHLDRLERAHRWWRAIAAAVALALALLMPTADARSQPVAITIAELVGAPERYSGKEVAFDGILVGMSDFYTVGKSTPAPFGGKRVQLAMADMTGAQILVITYVPSYDLPTLGMLGRTGTAYAVRGVFYYIPIEPGPPLHLVVVLGKDGLKKK